MNGKHMTRAFERLPADEQQYIRDEAAQLGIPVMNAMIERCLGGLGGVQQQLYSLRKSEKARPGLRVVK